MFSNFSSSKHIYFQLCALTLVLVAQGFFKAASAQEFNINGFGTLAVTHDTSSDLSISRKATNNRADSNTSMATDSLFGVQANIIINDKVDIFTQLVFEDSVDTSLDNRIKMGFLRYKVDTNWSVLAGRINSNIYMLSDYRYVSHALVWATPPLELYAPAELAESVDGFAVHYKNALFGGFADVRVVFGEVAASSENFTVQATDALTLSAQWQRAKWTLFTSYSKGNLKIVGNDELDLLSETYLSIPRLVLPNRERITEDFASDNSVSSLYTSMGIRYESDNLYVQSEVSQLSSNFALIPQYYSGYVAFASYIGDFAPYVVFAFNKPKNDVYEPDLSQVPETIDDNTRGFLRSLSDVTSQIVQKATIDQSSIALGVRWDVTSSIAIKAQYEHFILNNAGIATPIQPADGANTIQNGHMNVFHLSANFIF